MQYAIVNFELTSPPAAPIRVGKRRGCWILVRMRGVAIGWLKLFPSQARKAIQPRRIVDMATERFALQGFESLTSPEPVIDTQRLPSISVVVCTRNHPEVLRRQLQSLMRIEYAAPHEVIVVDNAPTDDRTERVVREFPSVKYVCEPTPGLDFARNAGLVAARHFVVAYTDDDAVVDPAWLSGIGRNYLDPDVHAVTGLTLPFELRTSAQIHFERYGGMQRGFRRRVFAPLKHWTPHFPLGSGDFGAGVNMSIRRDVLLRIGGFDNALDTGSLSRGGGDLDIMARVILDGGTLVYDPGAIVWHQHRQTMRELRRQMWDYGYGFYAYLGKYARHDLEMSNPSIQLMIKWFHWYLRRFKTSLVAKLKRKSHFPLHLQALEMLGALAGWRVYERAVRRARDLARRARPARAVVRRAA